MRLILAALAFALVLIRPAAAQTGFDGVWLFDDAPDYPGVTMMQVTTGNGVTNGIVTTQWYGPMRMRDVRIEGDTATFEMRTLNDREHRVRTWTAHLTDDGVTLAGDIWSSHVEQTGVRGTPAEAAQRTFMMMPLPPMRTVTQAPLAKTPPMGWSSWNKFGDKIDDKTIREIADAMVSSGLRDAGYVYVNIDDGWQGTRDAQGNIRPNDKFPDMKALADYVHGRGLKLGIYSSQGPKTCAGYEGSYGHVAQDATTYAAWGIDYLKYDLCSGEWFYNDRDSVMRSYAEMGAALQATGREIVFALCEYGRFDVGEWGRRVGGHSWRTTGDIVDDYETMARIGFEHNGDPANAGPGGWNDADMLEVGNGGMSADEYRTHMALWAISAAPLLMGHDLRTMDAETKAILENPEVIAIDQDALGVQGRKVRGDGKAEIWSRPLADGGAAVAIFNRGTEPTAVTLAPGDAGAAGLDGLRDVWRGAVVAAGTRTFTVAGHGVVLLRAGG
ncbi:MAG TPA: glycoside hydrolase family 27 protein [Sphingomonas sp.]|nr:glycoside hydrolase family 27 protein [Sphingomonas sp.]